MPKATKKGAVPEKKAVVKKMSSRELIVEHCEITREDNLKGNVITCDGRRHRMNRFIDDLSDKDCDRVFEILKVGDYIKKLKSKVVVKKSKGGATVHLESVLCGCGCKSMTKRGSKFLQGHDMKLKSKLRKAAMIGNANSKKAAIKALTARGWGLGVPKKVAEKKAPKPANKKTKK